MDEVVRDEVRQWLLKARHDLESARVLAGATVLLLDTAVYHCQQAAEKALKGFLAYHGEAVPKTHALPALLERCKAIAPALDVLDDGADFLTPFATEFRYPGPVVEPSEETTREAIEAAAHVLDDVSRQLPPDCTH